MCDLHRKLPLRRNHFFVWLKTANFSTACGTSTLKSLLSLGPDAPHVHLRLRKRLSRCTLDCGFKTSESPALRGFEAERGPIRGTSLYLVLKSNGQIPADSPPKRGARTFAQASHVRRKRSQGGTFPRPSPKIAHSGSQGQTAGARGGLCSCRSASTRSVR